MSHSTQEGSGRKLHSAEPAPHTVGPWEAMASLGQIIFWRGGMPWHMKSCVIQTLLPSRLCMEPAFAHGTFVKCCLESKQGVINIIIILAGAIALIIGFGISGKHFITVTTFTSAGNIGEDGILSCTFEPDIKLNGIVIQWLKEGLKGLVHEFKEGKDDLSQQHEMFRGRTAVFADQVVVGNASLRLRNVQLTDAGTYTCYIRTSKGKGNANLEYKTGAFSVPELNVDYNASSESLRCEAPRWFPQPTVAWASQVDQGANFSEVSNTSFELNSENVTMKVVSVLYNVTINNTYSCMIENNIAKATGDIKVTDSEVKRRSQLQLLNSGPSLWVSSVFAAGWTLLSLSTCLMLR